MQDPESLVELTKQRMAELNAAADRRRLLAPRGNLLTRTRRAILGAWSHITRDQFA
jgi:hypothetical protein